MDCNEQYANYEREKALRLKLANLRIESAMKALEITQVEAQIHECQTIAADHQWGEWLEGNQQSVTTSAPPTRPAHLKVVPTAEQIEMAVGQASTERWNKENPDQFPIGEPSPAPQEAESEALKAFMAREGAVRHDGGPCPVAMGQNVEIWTRGCADWPVKIKEDAPLTWRWENHPTDVLAYRILEPSTPETPEAAGDEGGEGDGEMEHCAFCGAEFPMDHADAILTDDGWQCPKCTASANPQAPQPVSDHVRENGEGYFASEVREGYIDAKNGIRRNTGLTTAYERGLHFGTTPCASADEAIASAYAELGPNGAEQMGGQTENVSPRPFIDDTEVIHPDPTLQSGETGGAYDAKHEAEVPDAGIFEALRKPVDEAADAPAPVDMMEA